MTNQKWCFHQFQMAWKGYIIKKLHACLVQFEQFIFTCCLSCETLDFNFLKVSQIHFFCRFILSFSNEVQRLSRSHPCCCTFGGGGSKCLLSLTFRGEYNALLWKIIQLERFSLLEWNTKTEKHDYIGSMRAGDVAKDMFQRNCHTAALSSWASRKHLGTRKKRNSYRRVCSFYGGW